MQQLRQAVVAGCEALESFDLDQVAAETERQQALCARLRRALLDGPTRRLIGGHMDELRELKTLTALQRTLVEGGQRAIQMEINLARRGQSGTGAEATGWQMGE